MQKLFFLFFLLVGHLGLAAQELQLENVTVQDKWSKTVYIGIDNYFKLTTPGYVKSIVPQQGIDLMGDSLRIRANKKGELSVIFLTRDGRENVTFTSKVISDPFPSISGWTDELVDKSLLLNRGELIIKTFRIDDTFHEGYKITSFEATINNETFQVNGSRFSSDLLAAIRKAKKGDKLRITKYTAYNETVKKTMRSSGASYEINE